MLVIQNLSYTHPGKQHLFSNVNLSVNHGEKVSLIGNNGAGKSTLLKIIAKILQPAGGTVSGNDDLYYVPQLFGQYDHLSVAQALGIEKKLFALHQILKGNTIEQNFIQLNDDWNIEDRARDALAAFDMQDIDLSKLLSSFSGGQKTKLFLAGIGIHQPQLILLDEPTNHLDTKARSALYDLTKTTKSALIVVSHDRTLLNRVEHTCELQKDGLKIYGGNYDFYRAQKQEEQNALFREIENKEKALRKAKAKERETIERQQKLDSRGKGKQEKAGIARIMMNTLRNDAENSTSKLKRVHAEKTESITEELRTLRTALPAIDKMRFDFDDSALHTGKILFTATDVNYSYEQKPVWTKPLNMMILSGERIVVKGANGSGKTTLLHLITGHAEASTGKLHRAHNSIISIDQHYSLLNNEMTVYEQAAAFSNGTLQEHEIRIRLHRFLFTIHDQDKKCSVLSGGERMRLVLCCITIDNSSPDIIMLDEPTNNLDIQNVDILTAALKEYRGTMIVVSHDENFIAQLQLTRTIDLNGMI